MNKNVFNPYFNDQDMITQEDPNASMMPMPEQVDFPVRSEAPPEINKFQDLLYKFNSLKNPQNMSVGNPVNTAMSGMPDGPLTNMDKTIVEENKAQSNEQPKFDARLREETSNPRDGIDFSYDKLQEILKNRDSAGLNNILLRAGMMANQGISRMGNADVRPDEGALQALSKQADMPLENFSTSMRAYGEIEEQDPKSDVSKFTRDLAKNTMLKMDPNFKVSQFENMSASQLKRLGFDFTSKQMQPQVRFERVQDESGNIRLKAFDTRTGEEVRDLGTAGFANQFRTDPNTGELIGLNPANLSVGPKNVSKSSVPVDSEKTSQDKPLTAFDINKKLNPATKKLIQASKQDFNKETEEARKVIAGIDGTKEMLNLAEKNPASKPIVAAAITRLFEKGVLTDKDVERYVVRQGIFNSAEDYASALSTGTFSKEQIVQLIQALNSYKKQQQDQVQNIANQKANNLKEYIDPNLNIKSNELSKMLYTTTTPSKEGSGEDKVRVISPEGQTGSVFRSKLEAAKKRGFKELGE